jgi:hypothetical protein
MEGGKGARNDTFGLHAVPGAELQQPEEQKKQPGKAGDEKVLLPLQRANAA